MKDTNQKAAEAILNQQSGAKKWGVTEHLYCMTKVLIPLIEAETGALDDESRKGLAAVLRAALKEDGLGGNASQFRQALVKAKLIEASTTETVAGYE